VGRDASPYAFRPRSSPRPRRSGYRYDFWGPNLNLKPEQAKSYEFGTELSFFDDRLGLDLTYYKKRTEDQIVNDIRESYAPAHPLQPQRRHHGESRDRGRGARDTVTETTSHGRPPQLDELARQDPVAPQRGAGGIQRVHVALWQRAQRHDARLSTNSLTGSSISG